MRAYLLIFDGEQISRKEMIKIIDGMPDVVNWHAFFGNTMCLASSSGARTLARKLNGQLPNLRYLITEVEPDQKGGRMPKSVLTFLNSPTRVEVEPA